MSENRNKSLVKECFNRDFGICCCCGFKASEAHHIIPLCKDGTDMLDNMVSMCHVDHHFAPNTKEAFNEYIRRGGVKLDIVLGRTLNEYFSNKHQYNDITLQQVIDLTKSMINTLRAIDIDNCIDMYGIKY